MIKLSFIQLISFFQLPPPPSVFLWIVAKQKYQEKVKISTKLWLRSPQGADIQAGILFLSISWQEVNALWGTD